MAISETLKVLIIDDHFLIRDGVKSMLLSIPGVVLSGECENGTQALEKISEDAPDLVFLDISMPEMDGIEAMKKINKHYPEVKVIILSQFDDPKYIKRAFKNGANAYLLKGAPRDEFKKALDEVRKGNRYLSEGLHEILLGLEDNNSRNKTIVELTRREKQILELICDEFNTNEIAEKLFVSPHTVESHRSNLLLKTDCKNSVGLVRWAIEQGVLD